MTHGKTINVVAWMRVSSKEQKDGYSLDAQRRAIEDYCASSEAKIIRVFSCAESAKPGAARKEFNAMLDWVRHNVRREQIGGMVFHKLDRACRNMRDAVRLKEIEQEHGVRLFFVDQQFGEGAAGQLSFNILASVAQFYSDNLKAEVLKGMDEKAKQGWFPTRPPFGYRNDSDDENEPIKQHLERAATMTRAFELFALGDKTVESLAEQLHREGHIYRPDQPKFPRTALTEMLRNRFYIGKILWHGRVFQGKHRPLVDMVTFNACQDVLDGRKRRTSETSSDAPLSGGLFRCKFCGQAITGERIRRRLSGGSVRDHLYYRCANNHPGLEHPIVRFSAEQLDDAIVGALRGLKLPNEEITNWFRTALARSLSDEAEYRRRTLAALRKRETELEQMQDRLLNAHLSGTVDDGVFRRKSDEFKIELARVREEMGKEAKLNADYKDMAVAIFDLTQRAAETWLRSNNSFKRELLDVLCLNRVLDDASLYLEWRKPFDAVAETAKTGFGIPIRI
ncbi:MAG: recombinase family protein [Planctomycetota bacterium]